MVRGRQGHRGYEMGPLQNKELNHEAKRRGYLLPVSTLWLDGWEGRINAERTDKGNKWAGSSTPFKLPFMPRQKGREK